MRVYRHRRRPRETCAFAHGVHLVEEEVVAPHRELVLFQRLQGRNGWTEQTLGRSIPSSKSTLRVSGVASAWSSQLAFRRSIGGFVLSAAGSRADWHIPNCG